MRRSHAAERYYVCGRARPRSIARVLKSRRGRGIAAGSAQLPAEESSKGGKAEAGWARGGLYCTFCVPTLMPREAILKPLLNHQRGYNYDQVALFFPHVQGVQRLRQRGCGSGKGWEGGSGAGSTVLFAYLL